ncbi:FAD-dependent monooxygenase [Rhodococcoides fascians]|uniref:FAD-dependent monooxygenase n=1 Tax=Rhodococcoides fascians TaxID=1828 RepID=UPI00068980B3|nr:FAD-dependent monooxygenase [Rhodococcus fascians]
MNVDVDVAIAGFGPGGQMLASLLGAAGHQVVVLERFEAPYGLPRMSTLDGEIARLLQHAADGEAALSECLPQTSGDLYGADDKIAIRADWGGRICGHPSRLSLHQPHIEAAMAARIETYPNVRVMWNSEVVGLDNRDSGVALSVVPASDHKRGVEGPVTEIRARYVVGMDGAASFVRRALGIDIETLHSHDDRWYLTDFDILDDQMEEPRTEIHMQPDGPFYWGPNGARRCRTDVRLPDDCDPADFADAEHGYAWLEDHLGIPREKVRLTRRVLYRFRSQYATSFQDGRVFIGGDAAHAMTPFMAQGSCSAMRDSANLAWKLDLVLSGRAREALLDTYEPERLTHVIPFVEGSLSTWSVLSELDHDKAAGRDAFLRSGQASLPAPPGLTVGLLHRDEQGEVSAPVGLLSPQSRVRRDGTVSLLDDQTGFGFQVVSRLHLDEVLTPELREGLALLGAHLIEIGVGEGQVQDLDGDYDAFFDRYGVECYVSRPDFYVFGAAADSTRARSVLEDLLTQIGVRNTIAT